MVKVTPVPTWPLYGPRNHGDEPGWVVGYSTTMDALVWMVTLCHGDWFESPRVAVSSQRVDLAVGQAGETPGDPVTDGTLSAFNIIANSREDGDKLGRDTLEHLTVIAGNSVRRPIAIDGVMRDFEISRFCDEEIAVGRMPGNISVSVVTRDIPLEGVELGVVDLAEYGIDPAGSMLFHLDRFRTPARYP